MALCIGSLATAADELDGDELFTLRVKPMLVEKCISCHGDPNKELKGGLDVSTLEGFLKGGDAFEDVLIPGDAEFSFVMEAVRWEDPDFEMPPKENDRLTEKQISDLEKWIAMGAPWPSDQKQEEIRVAERSKIETDAGIIVATSGGLADEWTYRRYQKEDLWAFRPVEKPELASGENPVDAYVGETLDEKGFARAPEADPTTLIRRATLSLTGLPPTPEEVSAFILHYRKNPEETWTALIDRLLESPHYGERWGQHWLDVARYADTGGMSNDYERSNAWRYRDYVIRSFNEDKPYDEFIVAQLAGDELAANSVRERTGDDQEAIDKIHSSGDYNEQEIEWMVASGFLRMGQWDSAMVEAPEARQIYVDDIINNVGQTFMATTMRCVKCHDHKFDPIPTKDYYRMYSTFEGTQLAERPAKFLESENMIGMDEGLAMTQRLYDFSNERLQAINKKQEDAAQIWFEEHSLEYKTPDERKDLDDDVKPPRNIGLNYIEEGRQKVRRQDEWIWKRRFERYEPMVQSVYNGGVQKGAPNARKLRMPNAAKKAEEAPIETHILMGGALTAKGERVTPGVLSVIGVPVDENAEDPYTISEEMEGRRLTFAKWVADPRNPLTTRSFVNRIFQHHFGKPIAANANNFGAKGGKPTHPKLLDWLAADFVENGWKIKHLHREIMMSKTYRMATRHPDLDTLRERDPNNDWLAYFTPRRLTAEELRDGMLAISGELNTEMGGLPIMPEINMEIALQPRMIQFSLAPAYQPSVTPEQRNRRSIYAYRVRGQADPFLELFNQPNPNDSCESRDAVSVSPQAFTLFNSDLVTDRSIAFALRVEREAADLGGRIDRAFELALGRQATNGEMKRMKKYVKKMGQYHLDVAPEPVAYPTSITRSLVEEFSGKPFEYEEILPA
ncbi:MAG: PSD1 and planctomycete cytochrome C domain-containing protein, partial [Verrucomicrobiota bacterium]